MQRNPFLPNHSLADAPVSHRKEYLLSTCTPGARLRDSIDGTLARVVAITAFDAADNVLHFRLADGSMGFMRVAPPPRPAIPAFMLRIPDQSL
jgi:hypothetical protein